MKIYKDEWYPVYCLSNKDGLECSIPEDVIKKRWHRVEKMFYRIQKEIKDIYTETKKRGE